MREELIRFRNVDVSEDNRILLRHINMYVLSGEKIGICGLHDSGKTALASALCGKMKLTGHVYKNTSFLVSHYISTQSTLVDGLLLYENLFLKKNSIDKNIFINIATLKSRARELLEYVGLNIPPEAHIQQLDRSTKIIIQILKAHVEQAQLIVLDGVTDMWRPDELQRLWEVINCFPEISFIYVCNGQNELLSHCDRVFVMRTRKIAAILEKTNYTEKQLETYEFGQYITGTYQRERRKREKSYVVLELELGKEQERKHLELQEGEIVGIFDTNPVENLNFNTEVLNQYFHSVRIDGKHHKKIEQAIGQNLQIMDMNNPDGLLFSCFSRQENVCFPIIKKMSMNGIILSKQTETFINKEMESFPRFPQETGSPDTIALHIALQRLWVTEPKAVIMNYTPGGYHPEVRMAVIEVINRLADKGTCFLLLLSDFENENNLCNRIVRWNSRGL